MLATWFLIINKTLTQFNNNYSTANFLKQCKFCLMAVLAACYFYLYFDFQVFRNIIVIIIIIITIIMLNDVKCVFIH